MTKKATILDVVREIADVGQSRPWVVAVSVNQSHAGRFEYACKSRLENAHLVDLLDMLDQDYPVTAYSASSACDQLSSARAARHLFK